MTSAGSYLADIRVGIVSNSYRKFTMTGTNLRAAVQAAITRIQNDMQAGHGVDVDVFRDVVKYALEVFGDDARKVRPCVYVVADSIGGFTPEDKRRLWDDVSKRFIGRKVYKANPMSKLEKMLAEASA